MDFNEAAAFVGVDARTASLAFENIESGKIILLAISGKLASGKDTIAEATIRALGQHNAVHYYYSDAMKNEVDQAIAIIAETPQGQDPATRLVEEQDIPLQLARRISDLIQSELAVNSKVHARIRTKNMRDVLQLWGTEIRRTQDPNYWVKKTLRGAINTAASGRSVFITDVRFPNEVDFARALGFFIVRIEISPETQAFRLATRDSLPPTPEALAHSSEHALDQYDGFDAIIDNNGTIEATVDLLCAAIQAH